jgi:tight adherence protein C
MISDLALLGIIIGVIVIGAGFLIWIGIRKPPTVDDTALDRLEEMRAAGEEVDLEKLEMSQPFRERVIYPIARKLGEIATRFTPQNALTSISRRLELAGSPANLDPALFFILQFVGLFIGGGLIVLVFTIGPAKWPAGRVVLLTVVFSFLGFYFPQLWLGGKISRRQKSVRKSMPDALDLLCICVEAGLGFDAAMNKVSEKWDNELSLAFARVIKEIQLGKLRREALRDMADRIGLNELTSFVAAVIQSEQLGVSMSKVLRIQADQMRIQRRQLAEEEAHKAPLKMLVPMGLLIFPALMIVLLTPAALKLFHSVMGNMFK